jgi:MSHA biogenesis protein MshN
MSLLNKMLHDLAKQRSVYHQERLFTAPLVQQPTKIFNKMMFGGLFLLLLVLIGLEYRKVTLINDTSSNMRHSEAVKPSSPLSANHTPPNSAIDAVSLTSYIDPLSAHTAEWNPTHKPQEASKEVPTFNKVYAPPTLKEWHNAEMRKAVKAIDKGHDEQAIGILRAILNKVPDATDAREHLASLYLTYGDYPHATDVVDEGLGYAANNAALLTIKARLFLVQGKAAEAVQLLSPYHPSINSYPDFYGTLAAALEAEDKIDEAGSLYKALLHIEPNNGTYWLGYAIFLEHHHKTNEAINAYVRAGQNPDTDASVREFAENRLNTLQG